MLGWNVDWRSALLRRLARRLRVGEDTLRHLSTFQRFGERFEIKAPSEMVPIGARTLARALRTRAAPQVRPDWLWPHWLERQLDPLSPSFVPRGHLPFLTNVTHRNWTLLGNPDSPWEAVVDPVGLVNAVPDGWSVDCWIRDGERWVLPSRSSGVRQEIVGGDQPWPCVRTRVPLPGGGTVEMLSYATRSRERSDHDDGEFVAIEVSGAKNRQLTVAFALRPYNPEGLAVVEDLEVTESSIAVDGDVAVVLPARPEFGVASTFHDGDCLQTLLAGGNLSFTPLRIHDAAGLAQAAVGYPLEARSSIRVLLPLPSRPPDRKRHPHRPRVVARHGEEVDSAADMSIRWRDALAGGMQVSLPDERLQRAVDINRSYLTALHDPGTITAGPLTYHRFWFRDAAYQLTALDGWGLHERARDVLTSYPGRQQRDGFFHSQWHEWDANGAAIFAIAEHHRLTGDDELVADLLPAVRRGAEWINRMRNRRSADDRGHPGLLPAGVSAEHLGPYDVYYWDNFWCLRGLLDAAYLHDVAGDRVGAGSWRAAAGDYRDTIMNSVRIVGRTRGDGFLSAGPFRGVDAGMIGSLVACHPLGLLPASDPLVTRTVELVRERFTIGPAFFQSIAHTGFGTYLTLQLAFVELYLADPRGWQRLTWLLDAATSTYTWPEAIHPRTGGGCMGDGHHGWAAADFLSFIRAMLVRRLDDARVAVLSSLPDEWEGREIEVVGAPVSRGSRLDYRLTWSRDRPVLRWRWDGPPRTLTAPSLDSRWEERAPDGMVSFAPVTAAAINRPRRGTGVGAADER